MAKALARFGRDGGSLPAWAARIEKLRAADLREILRLARRGAIIPDDMDEGRALFPSVSSARSMRPTMPM
jgi:hypothetical protein